MTARNITQISAKKEDKCTISDLRTLRAEHWKAGEPGNSHLLFFSGSELDLSVFTDGIFIPWGGGAVPWGTPLSQTTLHKYWSAQDLDRVEKSGDGSNPRLMIFFFISSVIPFHCIERWVDTESTNLWTTYHLHPKKKDKVFSLLFP